MIRLSIIIPCYNIEKYIARCVDSIMSQIRNDVEVIVINDGSTDGSRHILSGLEKKYPKSFKVKDFSNGGLATARNRGIESSTGEYLWFVDGDDFLSCDSVDILLDTINGSDADIIAFNHSEKTENGTTQISNYTKGEYTISEFLRIGSRHFAWNKIYKRDIFSYYRFIDGLRNIEDFVFNLSVSPSIKKVLTLEDSLYVYECTNISSISRNRTKRHLMQLTKETFKAHEILIEKYSEIKDPELKKVWTEQLNTSYTGHIYSLLRFYNCRLVLRAIESYKQWGVYPFAYTGNYRQNIFSFIVNHKCLWAIQKVIGYFIK